MLQVCLDKVNDNFEYLLIVPLEVLLRKLGTIMCYLLCAFSTFAIYNTAQISKANGFNYEARMYLFYCISGFLLAALTRLIRIWLTGRRFELSEEMDLNFHRNFEEGIPAPTVMKTQPDFSKRCEIYDNETSKDKKQTAAPESDLTIREGAKNSQEMLDNLIGLGSVKEEVLKLKLRLELEKKQELQGRKNKSTYNMHMFFTGNPGTGKTTVARIITGILYDLGYIKENKCIEVGKQDLVGQYLGQSAQKTNAVIKSALGGVLFIDEAYSLCENYQSDGFAKESVEILLKSMEDYRDNLIIIFAGYTKEMKQFKEMNPGLKSRIGLTIQFNDYNADELAQIFERRAIDNGYTVPKDALSKVYSLCQQAVLVKDFGNGRFVENLFREMETNHAYNTKDMNAYDTRIMTVLPEDLDEAILDKIL